MDKHTNPESAPALEFRRPNQTIAIAPQVGSLKITLVMRRLFAAMLYFSFKDGKCDMYSRSLPELEEAAELKGQTISELREILEAMRVLKVDWNTETAEERRWKTSGLISQYSVIEKKGIKGASRSRVEWWLPPAIQEGLLVKAFFTPMLLHMITRLKCQASPGLYDICAQYETNRHGKEFGLTTKKPWEWWHPRLTGHPPAKGEDGQLKLTDKDGKPIDQEYKYFKRDTLAPAIEEINTWTDIEIKLVEHKVGRRIAEIQFEVRSKAKPEAAAPARQLIEAEPAGDPVLVEAMLAVGVAEPVARQFAQDEKPAKILQAVEMTKQRQRATNQGPLANPGAFFNVVLRRGYADTKKPKRTAPVADAPAQKPAEAPVERSPADTAVVDRLQAANNAYNALGDEERAALFEEFKRQDGLPYITRELARKHGLARGSVMNAFLTYYARRIGLPEHKAA